MRAPRIGLLYTGRACTNDLDVPLAPQLRIGRIEERVTVARQDKQFAGRLAKVMTRHAVLVQHRLHLGYKAEAPRRPAPRLDHAGCTSLGQRLRPLLRRWRQAVFVTPHTTDPFA